MLLGPVGVVLYWLFVLGGVKYSTISNVEDINQTKDDVVIKINIAKRPSLPSKKACMPFSQWA